METQNIAIMKALSAKMGYLHERQRVIAQNIANADTPDYRPYDLKPIDFSSYLKSETQSNSVTPTTTDPDHMPSPEHISEAESGKSKKTYEIAPDNNSVIIEEQLVKANEVSMDYRMITNLYQKNMAMFRIAMGKN